MYVSANITDILVLLRLVTYGWSEETSCCRIKEFPESSTLRTNPAEHKSPLRGAFHKIHSQSKLKLFCFQSVQSHPNDSFFNTGDTSRRYTDGVVRRGVRRFSGLRYNLNYFQTTSYIAIKRSRFARKKNDDF